MSSLPAPLRRLVSWLPVAVLVAALVVSVTIIVVGFRPSPASPERPVKIASSTWAPFVGPDLPGGGPLTELVSETLNRAGYAPEVSYTSWALATSRITSGTSIGVFPLVGSESRRSDFLLSDPLMDFEYVLFYDSGVGEPSIAASDDLSALRVGGIAGYDYWDELDDAVDEYIEFDDALGGFEALARGDIDVLAEGLLSGRAALADPGFTADTARFAHIEGGSPLVSSVESLYFMMEKTDQSALVMADFNESLAALKRSPDYETIVRTLGSTLDSSVVLEPVSSSGLVELLLDDGSPGLLAPRGTTALVVEWPQSFTDVDAARAEATLVRVKVTSGPSTGRVFMVDARSIALGEAAR